MKMPGANCSIVECPACRTRHKGLSLHKIPSNTPQNAQWRQSIIHSVNRIDPSFNPDTAFICSRHSKEICFDTGPTGRRQLKHGSLPTEFMTSRSIETPKPPPRKEPAARKPPAQPELVQYYNIEDVKKDLVKIKAPWVVLPDIGSVDTIRIGQLDTEGSNIVLCVTIKNDLSVQICMYGFPVHCINVSVEKCRITKLLQDLDSRPKCYGIQEAHLQQFAEVPNSGCLYYRHVTYISPTQCESTVRATTCQLLLEVGQQSPCHNCHNIIQSLKRKHATAVDEKPLGAKAPLHKLAKEKILRALRVSRQKEKRLNAEIHRIQKKLASDCVDIDSETHNGLKSVLMENTDKVKDPLMKLFWQEQVKAFGHKNKGMRWHPAMIRLAILLHSQSTHAYDTLRKTGILKLPGHSTLRDYSNVIHPKAGFLPEVIQELRRTTANLEDNQRYVVLLHDEMTIKSDLVFDRRSSEIVGFINREHWQSTIEMDNLATHALVFYIVGINTNIKMSLGFFATKTGTADVLHPYMWQAISYLESSCKLKVICSTSDKASPNQKLYRLHNGGSCCYKTVNLLARDRYLYFFSDVPHLIKTVRNNLSKSGSNSNTKYFWNNGRHLLWKHIVDLYQQDTKIELHRTRLTCDHINLTPHSVMNVKLAAQVLSYSVGTLLKASGRDDVLETAKFVLLMDRFFDCLNVRSVNEGKYKRKPDLLPYTDVKDPRFEFLQKEFLGYLSEWKKCVESRPGEYTKTERGKMFLSDQTYQELWTTANAAIEATQDLLKNGVKFVLTNKFCQDPLEEHFGRHRGMGRRSENPTLWTFGYQENKIRIQRSLALTICPKGNVSGARKRKDNIEITSSPMKKIKRQRNKTLKN
ncbi:PREDICTED: uncharacterized protein LOC106819095 isoform X2 [Priapulus caudatus]|uniref:Uncharacterized protein LOC106819095 isoform X2 n=1 Tax=Priapulus caudatus TaxID=37621 RepID=A0ABM1F471_PRICU|nr:PREDICTED: uncharacterized protein LOC106819095 isoform X2 [Priapulus caudatus]